MVVLDSGYLYDFKGPQLDWLNKELKALAERPVKIPVYHVPIYPYVVVNGIEMYLRIQPNTQLVDVLEYSVMCSVLHCVAALCG